MAAVEVTPLRPPLTPYARRIYRSRSRVSLATVYQVNALLIERDIARLRRDLSQVRLRL